MSIEVYPVKVEGIDGETKDSVFNIEMVDEACAQVKILGSVNVLRWDELSAAIRKSLLMLKLEGDASE